MTPTITVSRYCCPACGGANIQTLDWVTVNDEAFVGGDPGSDYWCPDCESHPGHIDECDVTLELCLLCASHAWGTRVPLPGVWLRDDGSLARCVSCNLYPTDLAAAEATSAELFRRGGAGRVAIHVAGISAAP